MISPRAHLLNIQRDREWSLRRDRLVRLDRNEQVTPWPEAAQRDILGHLPADVFNGYPDPRPLYERLSRLLGIGMDGLFVTAGSDAAIRRIFETFVEPGDTVVYGDPTYPMYSVYSQLYQARVVQIPYDHTLELPVEQVFLALRDRPRLLAIVNPSQPTGTPLPAATLRRICAAAEHAGTLLIIDEAYYPFYPETALDWSARYSNVIVTRTFSKAAGLAGARVGYLVANPQVVDFIGRTRGSHEVNSIGVAAACYLLDHPELIAARLREIELGRAVLLETANELRLEAPNCVGNFQLIRVPNHGDPAPWLAALQERGYLVKGGFTAASVRDCFRVTLANPEIMTAFCAALTNVAQEQPSTCTGPFSSSGGILEQVGKYR